MSVEGKDGNQKREGGRREPDVCVGNTYIGNRCEREEPETRCETQGESNG